MVAAGRVVAVRSRGAIDAAGAPSIMWSFQQVMTRGIKPDELQILLTLYESQLQQYQQLDPTALEVLKVGMAPLEEQLVPAQVAAMLFVARAILNTNEAITRN